LNDLGVDGDLANVIFGVALIHALVTGGGGVTGQVSGVVSMIRRRRSVADTDSKAVVAT